MAELSTVEKAVQNALILEQTLGNLDRRELPKGAAQSLEAAENLLTEYFCTATNLLKGSGIDPLTSIDGDKKRRTMHG